MVKFRLMEKDGEQHIGLPVKQVLLGLLIACTPILIVEGWQVQKQEYQIEIILDALKENSEALMNHRMEIEKFERERIKNDHEHKQINGSITRLAGEVEELGEAINKLQ